MKLTRRCRSEAETMDLGAWLGRQLAGGEMICLDGPLGCGKTCFVRGLARGLGLDPTTVSSPTFIICRRHEDGRLTLVHVDAFRLSGPQDLEAIGWDELVGDSGNVVAVEWPARIREGLPADRIEVAMEHTGPSTRLVRISAPPATAAIWEPPDERRTDEQTAGASR